MKKTNKSNRLLSMVLAASAICALSTSAFISPAIAAPEGGAPSGLIPGDMIRINVAEKVIIINMSKKDMVQVVLL